MSVELEADGSSLPSRPKVLSKAALRVTRWPVSAEITIGEGGGATLAPHPLRAAVLGELHARPFTPIETPRRVLHFAFDTSGDRGEADRAALVDFCTRRGLLAPAY